MGHIYHSNAKTTLRIREELKNSDLPARALAEKHNLNIKTVYKWRNSATLADKKAGPSKPKCALSDLEQQSLVEFRRQTKLSLDDIYISFKDRMPNLSRSNLHRCFVRHGVNILPKDELQKREKKKFKDYELGFVHIDITKITISNKQSCYLFVAIDRCSKYVYVELHERQTTDIACLFLKNALSDIPFKVTKILTDNGAQFTYKLLNEKFRPKDKTHPFDAICEAQNIEHRLTKFRQPWTNGQVEVFNREVKKYTSKQFYYEEIDELKQHIFAFILLYNCQKPLKALKFKNPLDFLIDKFNTQPELFNHNPNHKIMGLNNY